MKATLEYQIPEEDHELRAAINASRYRAAVAEFDEFMRKLYNKGAGYYGQPGIIGVKGGVLIDWMWERWRDAVDELDDIS